MRLLAICLGMILSLASLPALAQNAVELENPETLYLFKTTIPDEAVESASVEFEILVSPSNEIRNISVAAGRPLCTCFRVGNPPRLLCLIGCPGGSGGGGVLLENPLLVEFTMKPPTAGRSEPLVDVTARPLLEEVAVVRPPLNLEFMLNGMPALQQVQP